MGRGRGGLIKKEEMDGGMRMGCRGSLPDRGRKNR